MHCGLWCAVQSTMWTKMEKISAKNYIQLCMYILTYVLVLSYDFKKCHRLRNWFHQSLKSIIIDFETNRITCLNCTFLNT